MGQLGCLKSGKNPSLPREKLTLLICDTSFVWQTHGTLSSALPQSLSKFSVTHSLLGLPPTVKLKFKIKLVRVMNVIDQTTQPLPQTCKINMFISSTFTLVVRVNYPQQISGINRTRCFQPFYSVLVLK